ncbi:MAG: hypothetical protein QNJ97_04585 [Myxococcota bacterium]|nr:hypothetical protein [Myxococcota bacterium]
MRIQINALAVVLLTGVLVFGCSDDTPDGPCGNGIRELDERCDDGNTDDGDGCSAECLFEHNIRHEQLCTWLSNNWVGVFILYAGPDAFYQRCMSISSGTEMVLIQEVRRIVPDGHFDIFLGPDHPDNTEEATWEHARIVRLVVTDSNDGVTIVKTTDALAALGLTKGTVITAINGTAVDVWVAQLMERFPQSSEQESREEALKTLFATQWKFWVYRQRIDIPLFDGESVDIGILNTETGATATVTAPFERFGDWDLPGEGEWDFTMGFQGHFGTIQDYYVDVDEACVSEFEYAVLKAIDGENWVIYYLPGFYDYNYQEIPLKDKLTCFQQLAHRADRFVLDLRDTFGGGEFIPVMFYNLQVDTRIVAKNKFWQDGTLTETGEGDLGPEFVLEPEQHEGFTPISRDVPIYIWPNSVCGSGCDLFNIGVKTRVKPEDDNIVIIGKKTAGRIMGVEPRDFNDYVISAPTWGLFQENGDPWEGIYAEPDVPFDVDAVDYQSADQVLAKFIAFIKSENL